MADRVVLLDFWPSPFGMRLRVALAENGVKYEYKDQDPMNKSALLLQSNPASSQEDPGSHSQWQTGLRVSHCAPLLPSDPYLRSQATFWADFVDKMLYDLGRKTFTTKGEEQEAAKKEFIDCIKLLEVELGDKPFFGGEKFGFVDVTVIPYYSWFSVFEKFGNFSIEPECPKFIAWAKRCLEKESVSNSLPDQDRSVALLWSRRKGLEYRVGCDQCPLHWVVCIFK